MGLAIAATHRGVVRRAHHLAGGWVAGKMADTLTYAVETSVGETSHSSVSVGETTSTSRQLLLLDFIPGVHSIAAKTSITSFQS